MALSASIWGPHYWFVLFTIALNYPLTPNKVTKKNIMILFKMFLCLYRMKKWVINLVIY